jgi:two-component system chemotaxis response regulator CheY
MIDSAQVRKQSPSRVLLVEDNLDGVLIRQCLLEEIGCQVVIARSGVDALAKFGSEEAFDLVVTDYKMPEMDGAELVQQLRGKGFDRPIVLVSGFADSLDLSKQVPGATVVIQKSFHEAQHLTRAVKKLLTPKKPASSTTAKRAAAQAGSK